MKINKRESLTLKIRFCTESGAVYLGLREHLKVGRTEVRQRWPLVAVDFARDGRVVGIECVGMEKLELGVVLDQAGVKLPMEALRRATIQPEVLAKTELSA